MGLSGRKARTFQGLGDFCPLSFGRGEKRRARRTACHSQQIEAIFHARHTGAGYYSLVQRSDTLLKTSGFH